MRRVLVTLLALALVCQPALAADDYPRDWDLDVLHYRFELTLSDDSNMIRGRATLTVQLLRDGMSEMALDLIGHDGGGNTGMEVVAVTRDGQPVSFTHADNRLLVSFSTASTAGERRSFVIAYRGVPADGLIIDANMFGDRTFFGDNWPERARHWLPTVDHVSDKATVEWLVTAPDHYQVVGNGRLMEISDQGDGDRLTHWSSQVPLPPKVMVIGVARFAVQNVATVAGVPLQSWVYPQNRNAGFYDYAVAERVLRFFDGHVGPFPYAKLANVQSKTRYGGMENASNIFYSERSVSGTRGSEGLIAHEVAHQWFGDSVTENDWHHLWLSEGFATYFTQLYNEFTHGRDELARGMRSARDTVIGFHRANPELALIPEQLSDPQEMLNRNAYQKGAWVLHMLRRQIGDDAFWAGIRAYYREYRDRNALTADLRRVMERASGQSLEWFFRQWAEVAGHPRISGTYSWDAAASVVRVSLAQEEDGNAVFRFPLDLGAVAEDGSVAHIETVQVNAAQHTFSIALDAMPAEIVLDPDTWLLFEGTLSRR